MDNRRVFSQSNSRRSSSSGLFSTVKRIFSRQGSAEPQSPQPAASNAEAQSSSRLYPNLTSQSHQTKSTVECVPGTFDTTPRKRKYPEDSLPLPSSVKRAHRVSSSSVLGTPRQTMLSRRPSQVSTPDYTPQYHNVSNTSMGSVRRVYQFSGLPSPYQTRIRPPKSSKVTKRPRDVSRGTAAPSVNSTFDASMLSNSMAADRPSGPKSKTYKVLESILDSQSSSDPLAQSSPMRTNGSTPTTRANGFGNPHAAQGGARRKISAADVAKSQPTSEAPNPSVQQESSKDSAPVVSSSSQFNFGPIKSVPFTQHASEADSKPTPVTSAPSSEQVTNGESTEKQVPPSSVPVKATTTTQEKPTPAFSFAQSTTTTPNNIPQSKPASSLFGNTGKASEAVPTVPTVPSTSSTANSLPKSSIPQPAFSMKPANGKSTTTSVEAKSTPPAATPAAAPALSASKQFTFNVPTIPAKIDEKVVASAPRFDFTIQTSNVSI